MIKNYAPILAILFSSFVMAQDKETCESPVEDFSLDLNSITKCSIEEKKDNGSSDKRTKTFSVQVSTRRRVARKRKVVSSNMNNIESNKIKEINGDSSISSGLDLGDKKIASSDFNNEKVIEKVPFTFVEEIPLFKSCEKVPILQQKKCFNEEINKHIISNFKYPEKSYNEGVQGRVLVQFVIDKTGNVADFNVRTPYKGEELEKEAIRIIKKLPNFVPGKHNGKIVKVKYGVPINFNIKGRAPTNVRKVVKDVKLNEVYNFTVVDEIPTFKKCFAANDKSDGCFNKVFIENINKNFTYPKEAVEKNIEGKVVAYFVIDAEGNVVNVKTRAASGKEILEKATKELINKLPKFVPGKQNGKATNVKHAFPVTFKLE